MYKIEDITNKIIQGNCLSILRDIPDNTIDLCVTSPPYYALRAYNGEPQIWSDVADCEHEWEKSICKKCNGYLGELGQEPTPDRFVKNLALIFKEVYRVLKPTGSCYINIDDTFSTKVYPGIKKKSMMMVPERLALALLDTGYVLRNKIIWKKLNSMPESTTDRYSTSWEYVFFFTKNPKYYFEQQFEPMAPSSLVRAKYGSFSEKTDTGIHGGFDLAGQKAHFEKILNGEYPGRNHRDVWEISTQSFSGSHFAVFNSALIEKPIKASCPQFICTKCGEPRKKLYKHDGEITMGSPGSKTADEVGVSETSSLRTKTVKMKTEDGWSDCGCGAEFRPGIVLDPFMGSGTTGITAQKLGRNFVGCELNPEYKKMAEKRIQDELGLFSPL